MSYTLKYSSNVALHDIIVKPIPACSNLTIEALEQVVKYVQS